MMALVLNHQTKAQFLTRLRERHASASGDEAARLSARLADWIDAGDITDAQARAAFALTVAQWSAAKARMTTLRTHYAAVLAARGE